MTSLNASFMQTFRGKKPREMLFSDAVFYATRCDVIVTLSEVSCSVTPVLCDVMAVFCSETVQIISQRRFPLVVVTQKNVYSTSPGSASACCWVLFTVNMSEWKQVAKIDCRQWQEASLHFCPWLLPACLFAYQKSHYHGVWRGGEDVVTGYTKRTFVPLPALWWWGHTWSLEEVPLCLTLCLWNAKLTPPIQTFLVHI